MAERRRYFRIDDRVGVDINPLAEEAAHTLAEQVRRGLAAGDFRSPFDARLHTVLEAVRVQQPLVSEALELLNRKLSLLMEQLAVNDEALQRLAFTVHEVSLSACGLGLTVDYALAVGTPVHLALDLLPGEQRITTLARVVACEPAPETGEGNHYLRMDYEVIHPEDQEQLIQHVLRRQGLQLRHRNRD